MHRGELNAKRFSRLLQEGWEFLIHIFFAIVLLIFGLMFPRYVGIWEGTLLCLLGKDRCRYPHDGCRYRIQLGFPGGRDHSSVCRSFRISLRESGFRFAGKRCISVEKTDLVGGRLACECRYFPSPGVL